MEDSVGLCSAERAELMRLYSQYEYLTLEFSKSDLASKMTKIMNIYGKHGWRCVSTQWIETGATHVMERPYFNITDALERLESAKHRAGTHR